MNGCRNQKSHGVQRVRDGNPLPCAQCTPQQELFRLRVSDERLTRYLKTWNDELLPRWVEAGEVVD